MRAHSALFSNGIFNFTPKTLSMSSKSNAGKFDVVPTINSLHYGFSGILFNSTSSACMIELLKSGPVATY